MKIEIQMNDLQQIIQNSIDINVENVIKDAIEKEVKSKISEIAEDKISEIVNLQMSEMINDYINNHVIKIGGGWKEKEEQTFTIKEYVKNQLNKIMESKELTIQSKDSWGHYNNKKVSFEEFIENRFNMEEEVEKVLIKFMKDVRDDVNGKIKQQFDNVTKTMLSDVVVGLLSSNDTFVKIQDNVKSIANR